MERGAKGVGAAGAGRGAFAPAGAAGVEAAGAAAAGGAVLPAAVAGGRAGRRNVGGGVSTGVAVSPPGQSHEEFSLCGVSDAQAKCFFQKSRPRSASMAKRLSELPATSTSSLN